MDKIRFHCVTYLKKSVFYSESAFSSRTWNQLPLNVEPASPVDSLGRLNLETEFSTCSTYQNIEMNREA